MKVSQFEPFIGMEEFEEIRDCFKSKWITEGSKAKEFNRELLKIIGAKYGVFAPNGTLALYLALKSLGIGYGDEVIVPNFTFIASANAVIMAGAIPVFVDIDKENLQISVEDCDRVITKKTKAIMPVHMYGSSANMTQVVKLARERNLLLIEDSAQALGVKWNGKGCGSFGDVSGFSFFADKTLTTGEGGFVTTNNPDVYERLLFLRNQGRIHRGSFQHLEIGYNFRMTDIQCAIGLAQLKKLPTIIERKNSIYDLYVKHLSGIREVEVVTPSKEVSTFIPFRVVLMTKHKSQDLMEFLAKNEIEIRTTFYPLHKQPCFDKILKATEDKFLQNSIYAYEHGICLPSYPSLTEEKIKYVCLKIKEYYSVV